MSTKNNGVGRIKRNNPPSISATIPRKRLRYENPQVVPNIDKSDEKFDDVQNKIYGVNVNVPKWGTPVNRKVMKRAGPYILGPKLGNGPVEIISQYLARKANTGEYYQLKILVLNANPGCEKSAEDEKQGKLLLYSEFQLLSLLKDEDGIIRTSGLFSDFAFEEEPADGDKSSEFVFTGRVKKRIVLVVDCVSPHEFNDKSSVFISLQQYVIQEKNLTENKTLLIFYEIIKIVENLHKRNIIHRDLKLGNIVYNTKTQKVIITNFCLGKQLMNENDYLHDQRGSPAYISPDVLGASFQTPYKGKPSDIWALGVVLFTMLYSHLPFFETSPAALFKRIRLADYKIPTNVKVSEDTQFLVKNMLHLNPDERLTATEIREKIETIINNKRKMTLEMDQVVPDGVIGGGAGDRIVEKKSDNSSKGKPDKTLSRKPFISLLEKGFNETAFKFLKPQNLSVQRVGRDARQLTQDELNQYQGIISTMAYDIVNRMRNVPISQQMSNLSIRNRHDPMIATVPRQDVPINNVTESHTTDSDRESLRVISSRYGYTLYYNNHSQPSLYGNGGSAFWNRRRTIDRYSNLPNLRPTRLNTITNTARLDEPVSRLFSSLNEMFSQGRIPTPNADALVDFTGVITNELAEKIADWLLADYNDLVIIRDIFGESTVNAKEKVFELLRRCGVQMENNNGYTEIKREQTMELLVVLSYMLQATGYNNSYFVS